MTSVAVISSASLLENKSHECKLKVSQLRGMKGGGFVREQYYIDISVAAHCFE